MFKRDLSRQLLKINGKFIISDGYKIFEVNEVGARIFDLCNGKNSVETIAEKLAKFYNESYDDIITDVEKYLDILLNNSIISK